MPDQFVHSQRTSDPNSHPMIIVVGENPLARAVCDYLGAISVPDSLMSAHRFSGADVVVVAGYEANFAQRQRMDPQARAHRIHDRAFRTVYDAAACGVERIIVLSSAMMYGTTLHTTRQLPASRPDHLSWYDDSSPAAPRSRGSRLMLHSLKSHLRRLLPNFQRVLHGQLSRCSEPLRLWVARWTHLFLVTLKHLGCW